MVSTFAINILKRSSSRYKAIVEETDSTLRFDIHIATLTTSIIINKNSGEVYVYEKELSKTEVSKLNIDVETLMKTNVKANPIKLIIQYNRKQNGKHKLKGFFENISKRFRSKK